MFHRTLISGGWQWLCNAHNCPRVLKNFQTKCLDYSNPSSSGRMANVVASYLSILLQSNTLTITSVETFSQGWATRAAEIIQIESFLTMLLRRAPGAAHSVATAIPSSGGLQRWPAAIPLHCCPGGQYDHNTLASQWSAGNLWPRVGSSAREQCAAWLHLHHQVLKTELLSILVQHKWTLDFVIMNHFQTLYPVNLFCSTYTRRPKESGNVWFQLGGAIPLTVLKYWCWRIVHPSVQRIKLSTTVGSSGGWKLKQLFLLILRSRVLLKFGFNPQVAQNSGRYHLPTILSAVALPFLVCRWGYWAEKSLSILWPFWNVAGG